MNKLILKYVQFIVLLILVLFISHKLYQKFVVPNFVQLNQELTHVKGSKITVSQYDDKYVIVSYFQTWCGDCIREIPHLEELQEKIGTEKLKVILVSDESLDKIFHFQDVRNVKLDCYQSPQSLQELGIGVYPTTYLINPEGKVVFSKLEYYNWNSNEIYNLIK